MHGKGLLAILLLLAGCAQPEPEVVADAPDPAVEAIAGTEEVDARLNSNAAVCTPVVGVCGGSWGPDTWSAEGHTWVALDVALTPRDDPITGAAAPLTDVRLVVECVGERLTCPQEPLAVAQGGPSDMPLRIAVEGFRVADPDLLSFRLESTGPAPEQGTGASYLLTGTLSFLDPPGAGEDGDDEDDAWGDA